MAWRTLMVMHGLEMGGGLARNPTLVTSFFPAPRRTTPAAHRTTSSSQRQCVRGWSQEAVTYQ